MAGKSSLSPRLPQGEDKDAAHTAHRRSRGRRPPCAHHPWVLSLGRLSTLSSLFDCHALAGRHLPGMLPPCIGRKQCTVVNGTWQADQSGTPPPWNASSCPFEHAFATCGDTDHAAAAARLRFVPANECRMRRASQRRSTGTLDRQMPSLHLVGDSLMRQVYISLACGLWHALPRSEQESRRAKHLPCTKCVEQGGCTNRYADGKWPFLNAQPGFYGQRFAGKVPCFASLRLPNMELTYTTIIPGHMPIEAVLPQLAPTGTIVIEAGVHAAAASAVEWALRLAMAIRNQGAGRKVAWMSTPPQHFVGKSRSGTFEERNRRESSHCSLSVLPIRLQHELQAVQPRVENGTIDALIALGGQEGLGSAKLGNHRVGFYQKLPLRGFDCTHFCSPGPARAIGDAVLTAHYELSS